MVLPADIVEAVVARAPYQPGWDQIRAYLEDAGGDVNDVTANGKTILILFLRTLALRGRAAPVDPVLKFIVNLPDGVAWNLISFWPPRRYPHWVPLRVRSQNSYY